MKFINSIISIFAIAVFLFAIAKYIDGYSSDNDIVKIIYAQNKALEGDVDAVKKLLSQTNELYSKQYEDEYIYIAENIDKDFNESDSDYLKSQKLKRAIKSNKISFDEARKAVNSITSSRYKGYAYGLITELLDDTQQSTYDLLMAMSYSYLSSLKTGTADEEIYDIRDILIKKGDAKNYIRFWKLNSYSIYSILHFYSTGANAKMVDYYLKEFSLNHQYLLKSDRAYYDALMYTKAISSIPKNSYERMDKIFKYIYIGSWKAKDWQSYKIPLLAYLSYLAGDIEKYEHYKKISLSNEQIEDIKADYINYLNFSALCFYSSGDYKFAFDIIEMIPAYHRSLYIKRNLRLFLKTKNAQNEIKRLMN